MRLSFLVLVFGVGSFFGCDGDPPPSGPADNGGTTGASGGDATATTATTTGTGGTTTGEAATTTGTSSGVSSTGSAGTTTTGAEGPGDGGAGGGTTGVDGDASAVEDGGGASPESGTAPDGGGSGGPVGEPFPPADDLMNAGPYGSTKVGGMGPNGNYTVYRPTELAPGGALNPIVGWMSGGGTTHDLYALLPHLASHGFVMVASNTVPGIGAEAALGEELIAGIEWAIAENERPESELYQKLDTQNVASAGYSMGSLATFQIADDPRLATTLHISGGNMAPGPIMNLRNRAAFICGTTGDSSCNILSADCDIAAVNCDTDFAEATVPVFYANFAGGHLGILSSPLAEQIGEMSTAWLRYTLMHDATLAPRFEGMDCEYCTDSAWTVQRKGLP